MHRTNPASLVALLIGVALVPIGIGAAVVEHRDATEASRRALAHEARAQAESLNAYFSRARSLTQITARNPSFRQFYDEPGSRAQKVRAQGPALRDANRALAYLEDLFPASIGEACFIDRLGPENARAVKGRIEPRSALAPDETGNPFFRHAFARRPGQVYQSRPYVSPDTNEWVIANATPIRSAAHPKPAIVHFEITVESIRRRVASASERFDIAIVDGATGDVVIDSRFAQRAGKPNPHAHAKGIHLHPSVPLGRPRDDRFKAVVTSNKGAGTFEADRKTAAFARVDLGKLNANRWAVVAISPSPAATWSGSLGVSQIVMLLGALLLLGFAVTSLRSSQRELRDAALRDPVTGMANRRRLMVDLERQLSQATPDRPLLLAIFDLDGFKSYNDAFGHPAGDILLARLGNSLSATLRGFGNAYRMGGDEFCVLARVGPDGRQALLSAASSALSEDGGAFSITASFGAVLLPRETTDVSEALRIADRRMYSHKGAGRASAGRQSTDVLARVLSERNPELSTHLSEVTGLCAATAQQLALPEEDVTALLQASALHDVGKAAIPDAILSKTVPLTADEVALVRRHTVIGERILDAAPALSEAAKLVRWSHEWFDGRGYPDGIAGEEIPLGARIIAVCDAYHAMVSDRAHRPGRTPEEAMAELRRCEGTQFDPVVVEALCAALAEQRLPEVTLVG